MVNEFEVTTEGIIAISPADVHWKETRVDVSFSVYSRVIQTSIRLMEKGFVDPNKIVTHKFKLEDFNKAVGIMKTPERVKIVINL